jgi:hypothetical protein
MPRQIFQLSAIAAFLSGGTLALIPLNSIGENLLGVVIAFIVVNIGGYFLSSDKQDRQ